MLSQFFELFNCSFFKEQNKKNYLKKKNTAKTNGAFMIYMEGG